MKKIFFFLLFIPLVSFGQTYFNYVERDARNQVDWSKVGNDISKTFLDAAKQSSSISSNSKKAYKSRLKELKVKKKIVEDYYKKGITSLERVKEVNRQYDIEKARVEMEKQNKKERKKQLKGIKRINETQTKS